MKLIAMTDRPIRTYHELTREDRSGLAAQVVGQRERVRARLRGVRHVLPVTSGKGGVGKSFVAAGLAVALHGLGWRIGLLDADLNGASTRRLLGGAPGGLRTDGGSVVPADCGGVKLMAMDLLLRDDMPIEWREPSTESFVWRGAQEHGVVREFLADVEWGELDVLVIDTPPGAQRLTDIAELVNDITGCLIVTIPSDTSRNAVERAARVASSRGVPLLGVVENMSAYVCPECGTTGPLFAGTAGQHLVETFGVSLLARIPFDPRASELADRGEAATLLKDTSAGRVVEQLAHLVANRLELSDASGDGSRL